MASSSPARRPAVAGAALVTGACAGAVACAAAVAAFGEFSRGALVAVTATGALVAGLGLARRAGSGAAAVRRPGVPPLLGAVAVWDVVALVSDRLPTLSDLADPVLAIPALRAAATVVWLAAGVWLVTRPTGREAAAAPSVSRRSTAPPGQAVAACMRTTAGRVTVLAAWMWVGVHFLAR